MLVVIAILLGVVIWALLRDKKPSITIVQLPEQKPESVYFKGKPNTTEQQAKINASMDRYHELFPDSKFWQDNPELEDGCLERRVDISEITEVLKKPPFE